MSLSAVEELCISLQRLGPEAQRPPLHPRQAFKAQSKSKTLVGVDELSCTATQAEEAYRHAQHICWLLHTLPQQLQPPSPGWPASSSAPSTPPAPLSPAILVAEPEVQSPFFPNPGHPSPATSVAEVTARARSPSSAKAASPIVIPRSCQNCRTESTPEWRTGPHGPQTLCNACGLQWRRAPQRTGIKPIGSIAKPRHTKRRGSAPRKGRTAFCA